MFWKYKYPSKIVYNAPDGNYSEIADATYYDNFMNYISSGKKKKAFLKFIRSFGFKNDVIQGFEKHIKFWKGKYSYNWFDFQHYMFIEYCTF